MPWSSQTRVSCAWTSISSTNWFYIKQVLPRIFVSTCKIARSSLSSQRNGELYMPLRPLLNDLAWRSQRPFNGSWLSPDWVESQVRGHSWTISTTVPRSSSTRGSCARTGISRTGCFYIEQVSPRIFIFDLQSCEVFFKLPTSIGVL